jgi:hypothetical protein
MPDTFASVETPDELPTYDDAPRPITREEAEAIAIAEYTYRPNAADSFRWLCVSVGADGGYHLRDTAYSEAAARGWVAEKRRALVRRILAGECRYTIFYNRARDAYYSG